MPKNAAIKYTEPEREKSLVELAEVAEYIPPAHQIRSMNSKIRYDSVTHKNALNYDHVKSAAKIK
jgi:hypothetical protein